MRLSAPSTSIKTGIVRFLSMPVCGLRDGGVSGGVGGVEGGGDGGGGGSIGVYSLSTTNVICAVPLVIANVCGNDSC